MYLHALQNLSLIVQQIAIVCCLHQADYQMKYIKEKKPNTNTHNFSALDHTVGLQQDNL